MSGEYFAIQEVQDASKFYEDFNNNTKGKDVDSYSVTSRLSQDVKLHEMEEQLEIAENRCNKLKGQLDHMKKLYQNKADVTKNLKTRSRKMSYSARSVSPEKRAIEPALKNQESKSETDYTSSLTIPQQEHGVVVMPMRQKSKAISTDNTGAAVQTIHNILNGITNSVNRLSQLHGHLENDGRPTSSRRTKLRDSACGCDEPVAPVDQDCLKITQRTRARSENRRQLVNLPEEIAPGQSGDNRVQSSSGLSVKSKSVKKKKSKRKAPINKGPNSTITVNIINKKSVKSTAKHVEKKFKIEPVKMLGKESNSILSPKKSKKQIKKPKFSTRSYVERRPATKPSNLTDADKLVEIYHNSAAKGSDSDYSNGETTKSKSQEEDKTQKASMETVPSLPIDEISDTYEFKPPEHQVYNYRDARLSPINEHSYIEPNAPRTECYSTCSKNYELPTIASKMKQVAKSYMRQFNFHSIPFCAAKSTTPSHNIGINIQQVMNIIKTRQPITGISPTLAHNIGIAADKLHNRPFSDIVSTLGSRNWYGRSQCPLIRTNLNYQQLQEMAKEIPEEEEEPCDAIQHDTINGSGDTNRNPHSTIWSVDPSNQRNCTCIPHQGIGFQQVLSRYQANTISASTVPQVQARLQRRFPRHPMVQARQRHANLPNVPTIPRPEKSSESKTTVLKGKEKNLKEVLTNLHDDFQDLNSQYEGLSKKVAEMGGDADEETLKELENMERCLNNKEEEITMVMALYKEVLALKQQVKVLRDKASLASVALHQPPQSRFRDYNNPSAALHLTKLLRQIQTYQEMYKVGRRN